VSGKTATIAAGKQTMRYFRTAKAPNKHLCDCVIASYTGAHHKIAVMTRDTVYKSGKSSFYWNELNAATMNCVRVFEDVRDPDIARAFASHVASFKPV
jgi:hypothetical protein